MSTIITSQECLSQAIDYLHLARETDKPKKGSAHMGHHGKVRQPKLEALD